jgi:tetratricopeptide (TPR) repeat protein
MPTINKRFLLFLIVAVAASAGTLFGVHAVQADRIPDALKRQAERATEANKLDRAIHYYRQYLEFEPHDVETQVKLVDLMKKRNPTGRGQTDVIFLYEKILRSDPGRHEIRRDALAACLKFGRYSDAVTHADVLIKAFPSEASLWQQLGAAQAGMNRLPEAKESYERAVAIEPEELLGYQRLAQLAWRNMHDPVAARAVLDRMVKALAQHPESHLIRARFEVFQADDTGANRGDLKKAATHLHRVLELDPENADASMLLADLYQRERNIPAAHALLRDAVALYPRDLRLVKSLSWLELSRGNTPAAIAVLEDGLKATPEGFELLIPLADLLVQQGDTARTAEILKRLETRRAHATQVKYLTARIAMRDAKWTEAIDKLEALRREVTNMPGLETQLNLLLAVCANKTADFTAEEKAFQRVLSADPKNVQAHVGLSNLYQTLGRFDDATKELESAVQSPYSSGVVVAQYIRAKVHKLRHTGGTPEEWRRLEMVANSSMARFGPAASEPVLLQTEIGIALGKYDDVIKFLRKETARRPGDTRLWARLAEVTADRHGTSAGLAVVDEAQAAAGDGPDVRLARGKLYAAEPGRVRPLAPLAERIDSWPEADQLRLLYGMVELFDHAGDQPAVIRMLQRIAGRRPGEAILWVRIHERSTEIGDTKSAEQARTALVQLEGESGNHVVLCDAAKASATEAAKAIDRVVAAFGGEPTRSDSCVTLARLYQLAGKVADAARMSERAFTLEPTRYDAAKAWLTHLGNAGADERVGTLVARLAADPRWAGDPFRRIVASVAERVPSEAGTKLLKLVRPHLERDPDGLGWLADVPGKLIDPIPLLEEAVRKPNATADDWLRLALARKPAELNGARGKLLPQAYFAAVAVLQETKQGTGFKPELTGPSDKRLLAQSRLALQLSLGKPEEAAKVLEKYLAEKDVPKSDAAWCRRNLAMLYAVGGTPEDRARAMKLIKEVNEAGTSADELRATASVLTTLARYLEGADRIAILTRAAEALDQAYKSGKSPKDLFNLSQLYRAAGNRKESRECLQLLLDADAQNLYYLVAALEESTDNHEFAQAKAFAEKLLRHHTGEFRAIAAIARYECAAGRPEAALALADRYGQFADTSAGDHLSRSGRVAELLDELARLPKIRGTPAGRAITDAAVERYSSLIAGRPEAIIGVVGILAVDGRASEGFARMERLGKFTPARVRAAAGLAAVRAGGVSEQQATMVLGWIDECLKEDPSSPLLQMNRAEFFALRQDLDKAAAEYEKVLAADPRNVVALNNYAWILAAEPTSAERALELVSRATREVGLTGDLLDTRARIRITLKQAELAEHDLDDAIRLEPTALRWFHLALSRLKQGKTDDAARAFREAKRRGLDARGIHPGDLPTFKVLDAADKP